MHRLRIPVRNNQEIECFVESQTSCFEIWLVATVRGMRQVLSHYLTHDDLRQNFAYSKSLPFCWEAASPAQIPSKRHESAVQWEVTIARGKCVDLRHGGHHIVPPIAFLDLDRSAWNEARKHLLGLWSDGEITIAFESGFKVRLNTLPPEGHVLRAMDSALQDRWRVSSWRLYTYNQRRKVGLFRPILFLKSDELHLPSIADPRYLAHVFSRKLS